MRILYISGTQGPDYQCDMLFHGLRTEFGDDVVDVDRLWYMYAAEFRDGRHTRSNLRGHGFSLYGLLGSDAGVDRTDIEQKIRTRFFDLVIYGSVHRCAMFLREVLLAYPPEQVIFVDGEDGTGIVSQLLGMGIYFKRELAHSVPKVRPIQFAIPEERIGAVVRQKTKLQAFIDPRDPATYIYKEEAAYYGDYAESLFGVTVKKGGWDCLRHYEIMANGCIPLFLDIEQCPASTMPFLPKYELRMVNKVVKEQGLQAFENKQGLDIWALIQERINLVLHRHCTTRALARYVLETASMMRAKPKTASFVQIPLNAHLAASNSAT
jgi:hypothetical protein